MAQSRKLRPKLNAGVIAEAALEVADAEGLEAVTMRRVARQLHCAAMSLYDHVTGKDALLDLMADHAIGKLPDLSPGPHWHDQLLQFFTSLHDLFLEHPAAARVIVQRPMAGTNTLRHGGPPLALLLDAGFDDEHAVEVFIALASYTVGAALLQIARHGPAAADQRRNLVTPPASAGAVLRRLGPRIAQATTGPQFQRGLEQLLRGYSSSMT